MEIVDYDKTKHFEIMTVRDNSDETAKIQGYILRFVGESGKETRICCTPVELRTLVDGGQQVLE